MKARKRFSQNFLRDEIILQKMQDAVAAHRAQHLLEIGPGRGALTQQLVALRPTSLRAIEIDRDLASLLRERWVRSLQLIEDDVLQVDLQALHQASPIELTVGNLPYNISTPFLLKFEQELPHCPGLFLVQKEVGERLAAQAGSKDYGRLTLMIQRHFSVKTLFDVPPQSFIPVPAVNSSFIELTPLSKPPVLPEGFELIVKDAFGMRRKTLRNALAKWDIDYQAAGVSPQSRAEQLSLEEYVSLLQQAQLPEHAESEIRASRGSKLSNDRPKRSPYQDQ